MFYRQALFLFNLSLNIIVVASECFAQECWVYQKIKTNFTVYGIYCSDSLTRTAAVGSGIPSSNGMILRTNDGGETWGTLYTGSTYPKDVMFSNTDNGVAVGFEDDAVSYSHGVILHTTNGGISWSKQIFPYTVNAVSLSTSDVGVAVGSGGLILWTTNGGNTWTEQQSNTIITLYDVYCISPQSAVAVGEVGRILRTTDAGATWTNVWNNTGDYFTGVWFTDVSNGRVVGSASLPGGGYNPEDNGWWGNMDKAKHASILLE